MKCYHKSIMIVLSFKPNAFMNTLLVLHTRGCHAIHVVHDQYSCTCLMISQIMHSNHWSIMLWISWDQMMWALLDFGIFVVYVQLWDAYDANDGNRIRCIIQMNNTSRTNWKCEHDHKWSCNTETIVQDLIDLNAHPQWTSNMS